jgi:hypothetical protein
MNGVPFEASGILGMRGARLFSMDLKISTITPVSGFGEKPSREEPTGAEIGCIELKEKTS